VIVHETSMIERVRTPPIRPSRVIGGASPPARAGRGPKPVRLYAAFAAVWVLWGSTYLAIRIALEALPPLLMAGTRFLVAGSILYAWAATTKAPRPKLIEWRSAAIVGGLLLFVGNGGVVLSEQRIPSSLAALLVSGTPMWMTLLDWVRHGKRPEPTTVIGLVLGVVGVAILVAPAEIDPTGAVDSIGAILVLGASLAWAVGSMYSRTAPLPASPIRATGMEMLAGGAFLVAAGLVHGEAGALAYSTVTARAAAALFYLVVAGSLAGFTSYIYLLKHTTPARATTYAYVNPAVAVLLGWAIADEPITQRVLIAGCVIVCALVLITRRK
jgi:drug/metabolite transporter (DMT)-like permease